MSTLEFKTVKATRQLLQESYRLYDTLNKPYYQDVLDFMNLLFAQKVNKLSMMKFERMCVNDDTFVLYNQIVTKYNVNKPLFALDEFNVDLDALEPTEENIEYIKDIIHRLCNNLLEKLNYELKYIYVDNNKKFVLKYIT